MISWKKNKKQTNKKVPFQQSIFPLEDVPSRLVKTGHFQGLAFVPVIKKELGVPAFLTEVPAPLLTLLNSSRFRASRDGSSTWILGIGRPAWSSCPLLSPTPALATADTSGGTSADAAPLFLLALFFSIFSPIPSPPLSLLSSVPSCFPLPDSLQQNEETVPCNTTGQKFFSLL